MRADGSTVTVLVENDGLTTLALYSDASSTRLGTVGSGESECLALRVLTSQRLLARPTGGGDAIVSPPFEPTGGQGWRWTLRSSTVGDALSLVPAELCDTGEAP